MRTSKMPGGVHTFGRGGERVLTTRLSPTHPAQRGAPLQEQEGISDMDSMKTSQRFSAVGVLLCLIVLCLFSALHAQQFASGTPVTAQDAVSPAEARAIAKEAYIYGFPMVDGYRIQYAYFVDRNNPEFKAPWNQIRNVPRVFTSDDKAVQTPNSDT